MRIFFIPILVALMASFGCRRPDDPIGRDGPHASVGPKPYNVILISIDTLRADHLPCYGYERETAPHISRFAARSVVFARAYSQSPWTTPAHASLFTSLYPSVLGLGHWPNPGKIDPKATTLAEALRDHGYETAGFLEAGMVAGKFGFAQGFKPYRQGFKHIEESVPECLAWIKEQVEKKFFVFLHTYDVHRYDPPEDFAGYFMENYEGQVEKGIPLARQLQKLRNEEFLDTLEEADRRKIVAIYDDALRYVDEWLGRFFHALDDQGLMERTIIVLTSDHGEEFWDHGKTGHGYTNFEEMLHVPLIVYHPDIPPGRREGLVRLLDIAPSVTEMVGITTRPPWQGISFFRHLKNEEHKPIRFSFAEQGHVEHLSVQDDRWKLIRSFPPKKGREAPYVDRLYDCELDPAESRNLIQDHPEEYARLQKKLEVWIGANQKLQKAYKAGEVEIDPVLRKQLENLGYTGGDG